MADTIRAYDNGGKTLDRYTIIVMDRPERRVYQCPQVFEALAASECPFHPQGFGQHTSAAPGRHLGRRVDVTDLPADVQRLLSAQTIEELAP